ncbi:hypothetical protein A3A60_01310 [Candidatus Curtissbacteria bacterium RIFCSPLOWO2_01_FULL_42_26]|uniref:Uncharacterized protein n=1 Tax=Candidatus Curtissbacteria bacterium RIFCSPLOWO2_01_FULL_42_26 TaxID=1797729 RepID=A0A1F5HYB3_9BACT|nr:MAG: hypothetical protein A3A60_01310 [Candidatus Curtissbacteria bacterium RIFCSPLOWO2_01_FULL_42_26]
MPPTKTRPPKPTNTPVPPTATNTRPPKPTSTEVKPTETQQVKPTKTREAKPTTSPTPGKSENPPAVIQPNEPRTCLHGEVLPAEFQVPLPANSDARKIFLAQIEAKCELLDHDIKNDFEHTVISDQVSAVQEGIGIDANHDGKTGIDINGDGEIDRPSLSDQIGVKNGEPSLAQRIDKVLSAVKDGANQAWDKAAVALSAATLVAVGGLYWRRRRRPEDQQPAQPQTPADGGPDGGNGGNGGENGGKGISSKLETPKPPAPKPTSQWVEESAQPVPEDRSRLTDVVPLPAVASRPAREKKAHKETKNALSNKAVNELAKINVELLDGLMQKILSMSDAQLRAFTKEMSEEEIGKFRSALTLSGEDKEKVAAMKPPVLLRNFAYMYLKLSEDEKERIKQRRLKITKKAGKAAKTA